jgi:excisionase family DNA binding protein
MQLIDVKIAAAMLGVSRFTLETWKARRLIPFIKLGRRCLFDPRDLQAWIEKNKVAAKPRPGRGAAG